MACVSRSSTLAALVGRRLQLLAVHVDQLDQETHSLGEELCRKCPDKDWSLVDCISFTIVKNRGITDALTGDHQFTQAGFNAILAN